MINGFIRADVISSFIVQNFSESDWMVNILAEFDHIYYDSFYSFLLLSAEFFGKIAKKILFKI